MDKLTKGEWRIGNYRPYRQIVAVWDKSKDNDSRPGNRQICKLKDNGQRKANAQAIVTAVNNTYKRGINPEAVPELVKAIKTVKIELTDEQKKSYSTTRKWCIQELEQALKKAEL